MSSARQRRAALYAYVALPFKSAPAAERICGAARKQRRLHMVLEHRNRHFHTARLAPLSLAVLVAACSSRIPARVEIVDGRQIEIATAGEGGAATVVFEAGLCDDWTRWDEVASEV